MARLWVRLVVAGSILQVTACGSANSTGSDASSEGPGGDTGASAADGSKTQATDDALDDGAADAGADDSGRATVVSHTPLLHRASAAACTQPRPAEALLGQCRTDFSNCGSDQDCTAGANGRCTCSPSPVQAPYRCSYDECASDSDCEGGVCDCRESPVHVTWGTLTVCLGGNCRTDSDCGQGGYCSPSATLGCGAQSWSAYYCHTPRDQCVDDADCNEANAYCAYDPGSSRWVCSTGECADG
jgi:hypothetical protein